MSDSSSASSSYHDSNTKISKTEFNGVDFDDFENCARTVFRSHKILVTIEFPDYQSSIDPSSFDPSSTLNPILNRLSIGAAKLTGTRANLELDEEEDSEDLNLRIQLSTLNKLIVRSQAKLDLLSNTKVSSAKVDSSSPKVENSNLKSTKVLIETLDLEASAIQAQIDQRKKEKLAKEEKALLKATSKAAKAKLQADFEDKSARAARIILNSIGPLQRKLVATAPEFNAYAIWQILLQRYKNKTSTNEHTLREDLFKCKLEQNQSIDLYYSNINAIALKLMEHKIYLDEKAVIHTLFRGLPKEYTQYLGTLRSLIDRTAMNVEEVVAALRDYQENTLKLIGKSNDQAHFSENKAYFKPVKSGKVTNYTCFRCAGPHITFECDKQIVAAGTAAKVKWESKTGKTFDYNKQSNKPRAHSAQSITVESITASVLQALAAKVGKSNTKVDKSNDNKIIKKKRPSYKELKAQLAETKQNQSFSAVENSLSAQSSVSKQSRSWLLDSGSSRHLSHIDNMTNVTSIPTVNIKTASGAILHGNTSGTVTIKNINPKGEKSEPLQITNVTYVPDISANLLSVGEIADNSHDILFTIGKAIITRRSDGKTITVPRVDKMYTIHDNSYLESNSTSAHSATESAYVASDDHDLSWIDTEFDKLGYNDIKLSDAKLHAAIDTILHHGEKQLQSIKARTARKVAAIVKVNTKVDPKLDFNTKVDSNEKVNFSSKVNSNIDFNTKVDTKVNSKVYDKVNDKVWSNPTLTNFSATSAIENESANPTPTQALHLRFGHVSGAVLAKMIKKNVITAEQLKSIKFTSLNVDELKNCSGCAFGKAQAKPFARSIQSTATRKLMCAVSDVSGPIRTSNAFKYLMTITDLYTRKKFGFCLVTKDQTSSNIKDWITQVERETGLQVVEFHSDGGGEYTSTELLDWYRERGIKQTHTMRSTPQHNGIAERGNRTLFEMIRCTLAYSGLSTHFWPYAAHYAIYIRNRTPTKSLPDGVTPEAKWSPEKHITTDHIKTFGCDVTVTIKPDQRIGTLVNFSDTLNTLVDSKGKLSSKSFIGTYLGWSERQNGYQILNVTSGKVTVHRDVNFNEQSFKNSKLWSLEQQETKSQFDYESLVTDLNGDDYDDLLDNNELELVKRISLEDNQTGESNIPIPDRESPIINHQSAPTIISSDKVTDKVSSDATLTKVSSSLTLPNFSTSDNSNARRYPSRITHPPLRLGMVDARDCGSYMSANGIELEPNNYKEAMQSPNAHYWFDAIDDEMNSHKVNSTWTLVDRPKGIHTTGSRWVFKQKFNANGKIDKFKARVVAQGYTQIEGVDYFDTYAPVVKYNSLRVILSIATIKDYEIKQMDVATAFLNADIKETLYMEQPPGFNTDKSKVCKLNKTIYGLKQSPMEWNKVLNDYLVSQQFIPLVSDPCVYQRKSKTGKVMIIAIFVDDIISCFHKSDESDFSYFKANFTQKYKTTDLGDATWILKMKITRDRKNRTLLLTQQLYNEMVVDRFNMSNAKCSTTPEKISHELSLSQCPTTVEEKEAMLAIPYKSAIGSLLYATISTRPDIAHSTGMLARYLHNPAREHWNAAKVTLSYLKSTSNYGLKYTGFNRDGSEKSITTSAYSDANWAGDKEDRKSTTGYLVSVGNNLTSWKSQKQQTVAQSSAESEYIAVAECTKELLWTNSLLEELSLPQTSPSIIQCDNQAAISYTDTNAINNKLKHIQIKWHAIKDCVARKQIKVNWVSTTEQLADILTKPLGEQVFTPLRDQLVFRD